MDMWLEFKTFLMKKNKYYAYIVKDAKKIRLKVFAMPFRGSCTKNKKATNFIGYEYKLSTKYQYDDVGSDH